MTENSTIGERARPEIESLPGWRTDPAPRLQHAVQRLQPVVLGPPPEETGATADDDLDLSDGRAERLRLWLSIAGVAALVAAATTLGYWVAFRAGPSSPADVAVQPPPTQAAPTPEPAAAQTPPSAAPVPAAPPGVDMAEVTDELVPPATEGLSAPRRVPTILIRVENDREAPAR